MQLCADVCHRQCELRCCRCSGSPRSHARRYQPMERRAPAGAGSPDPRCRSLGTAGRSIQPLQCSSRRRSCRTQRRQPSRRGRPAPACCVSSWCAGALGFRVSTDTHASAVTACCKDAVHIMEQFGVMLQDLSTEPLCSGCTTAGTPCTHMHYRVSVPHLSNLQCSIGRCKGARWIGACGVPCGRRRV